MPTGMVPRAMEVSVEPWPRVTTFFGFSGISAVPRELLMETGKAPSPDPDVASLSEASEPQAVRATVEVSRSATLVVRRRFRGMLVILAKGECRPPRPANILSLIHISEPTRLYPKSRMPSSA